MRSPFSAMTLLDNFRGGYGNGGIIRSPLSAITLLDLHQKGVTTGMVRVRRERRLVHSGCKSHPGTVRSAR